MSKLKYWTSFPLFWLILTIVFYSYFEVSNAIVSCEKTGLYILTGITSFLGFWSLVGLAITGYQSYKREKDYKWLVIAGLVVIALFLADRYGRICDLDLILPR